MNEKAESEDLSEKCPHLPNEREYIKSGDEKHDN